MIRASKDNEYDLASFNKQKDGTVIARVNSCDYTMLIEARPYKEAGEDPLAIVELYMQYTRALGGRSDTVYVGTKDGEITHECIREAIEEFFGMCS